MKLKPGFKLRNICGENILTAEGKENIDFSNIISMNDTSVYLWQSVQNKEFTINELVKLLVDQYNVDEETARKDVQELTQQWIKIGICEK